MDKFSRSWSERDCLNNTWIKDVAEQNFNKRRRTAEATVHKDRLEKIRRF
jgi:hypothetical protein